MSACSNPPPSSQTQKKRTAESNVAEGKEAGHGVEGQVAARALRVVVTALANGAGVEVASGGRLRNGESGAAESNGEHLERID